MKAGHMNMRASGHTWDYEAHQTIAELPSASHNWSFELRVGTVRILLFLLCADMYLKFVHLMVYSSLLHRYRNHSSIVASSYRISVAAVSRDNIQLCGFWSRAPPLENFAPAGPSPCGLRPLAGPVSLNLVFRSNNTDSSYIMFDITDPGA